MKRTQKKVKEQEKKRKAKKAAMLEAGGASKYARNRHAPPPSLQGIVPRSSRGHSLVTVGAIPLIFAEEFGCGADLRFTTGGRYNARALDRTKTPCRICRSRWPHHRPSCPNLPDVVKWGW